MYQHDVDPNSLSSAVEDVKRLFQKEKNVQLTFSFHHFKATNHKRTIAAVDGSHNQVMGSGCSLAIMRVGYILYQDGCKKEERIEPMIVEFIMNNRDFRNGFRYTYERYYQNLTGEVMGDHTLVYEKTVERIRTLLEWERIQYLLTVLSPGDIILFDGSLMSGVLSTNHTFFEQEIKKKAIEKDITLVGLSKDTRLQSESIPISRLLSETAKKEHIYDNWFVSYVDQQKDTYFVRFVGTEDPVFRLDAIFPPNESLSTICADIAAYAYDPITYGYPYPLQSVHDAVRISDFEAEQCFATFKEGCLFAGITDSFFDTWFSKYHDQLDKISYGR